MSSEMHPTAEASSSIYEPEIEEREHVIESCPIDIYVSSINPRWGYPHKLMSYYEARPGVRDSAHLVIIDSGYSRIGSMRGVLEAAKKTDAEIIIPPDLTPGCDGYEDRDSEAHAYEVAENYWQYQKDDWDGRILLPIHPPFDYYVSELRLHCPGFVQGFEDDPAFDMRRLTLDLVEKADGVAVGGLRGLDVDERIEALRWVRSEVGYSKHIHALAPGTEFEMLQFLRNNPRVVDSVDISTPERAPANNKIPDATWKQHKMAFPRGTNVTTVRAAVSTFIALNLNYMLGPDCNDLEELHGEIFGS